MNHLDLADCRTIHFVAHSMGGLLVRSHLVHHSNARIGKIVMLGPPNQGSELVDILNSCPLARIVLGPAGVELGTDRRATPSILGPIDRASLVIAGDRSVNWINSLMIPGKDDGKVSVKRTRLKGAEFHRVVHSPHPFLPGNRNAIALTLNFLKTPPRLFGFQDSRLPPTTGSESLQQRRQRAGSGHPSPIPVPGQPLSGPTVQSPPSPPGSAAGPKRPG